MMAKKSKLEARKHNLRLWRWLRDNGPACTRDIGEALDLSSIPQRMHWLRVAGCVRVANVDQYPCNGTDGGARFYYEVTEVPPPACERSQFDLLDWWADAGEARSVEYADDLGLTRNAAWHRVQRGVRGGLLRRVSRGYGLTELGREIWEHEMSRRRAIRSSRRTFP